MTTLGKYQFRQDKIVNGFIEQLKQKLKFLKLIFIKLKK